MTRGIQVSVIIPAYNAAPFVARAVASALEQPEVAEVVLVEDGSPDGTLAACEAAAATDARVRLLRHPGGANRGAAESRTLGITQARADVLAFLDADDYYLPGRFARAARVLEDPAIDGVYEAVGTEYESAEVERRHLALRGHMFADREKRLTSFHAGATPETLFDVFAGGGGGFCHLDGLTVRRAAALATGGFLAALRVHQDKHFLLRLTYLARLAPGSLDEPVAIWRAHAQNRITAVQARNSLRFQELLYRDLLLWGARVGMRPASYRILVRRYVQLRPWRLPGFPPQHALARLVVLVGLAAQLAFRPLFGARVVTKVLTDAAGSRRAGD